MQTLTALMRERWRLLCRRIGSSGDPESLADQIEVLYRSPPRAYHSLEHIAACLATLGEFGAAALGLDSVEFALWLHDCVYDPKAKDNESRSADVAEGMLHAIGAARERIDQVRALIMATQHTDTGLSGDAALIADIDLAILGATPDVYERYAAAIREEYSFVPEDAYRAGRSAVMQGFISRARIFATDLLGARFESTARRNIAAEIHALLRP